MKFEKIDINKLTPAAYNPRKDLQPSDSEYQKIKKSIEEFGYVEPIIVNKDNTIVGGHQRLKILKDLGFDEIDIIKVDLNKTKEKALNIALNKITGQWDYDKLSDILEELKLDDFDIDITGFELDELDDILGIEKEVEEDDYEIELPEEPKSKYGDIYQLGNHRLMCGDSTKEEDVAKLMNGVKADMVMTDPPYNVDYSSKNEMLNYSDKGSHIQKPIENDKIDNFEKFIYDAYKNMANNTKEGGAFYIWHSEKEDIAFKEQLIKVGVYIHQTLIWVKNNFVLGRMDYQPKHEPCLYGWKEGAGHYFVDDRSQSSVIEDKKPDIKKMKKEELVKLLEEIYSDKISTTVIKENKPHVSDLHPTMKPIKLLARQIKNSSRINELVLDLFGGSGSTLITCEQLDRTCYMMEYDPQYIDVIIDRWETFTGNKAVLLNGGETK